MNSPMKKEKLTPKFRLLMYVEIILHSVQQQDLECHSLNLKLPLQNLSSDIMREVNDHI